jgi:hypothetical protein
MERMLATAAASAAAGDGSKIERLRGDLRRMPLFRQLVPMEAGIGWPVPLRREGKVYLTFPLFSFGVGRGEVARIELRPPFAAVTLSWATGRPVKYVTFAFERPWQDGASNEPAGVFPHEAVRDFTIETYRRHTAELFALYDALCASLAGEGAFGAEQGARFSELLRLLVEPPLEPYYRALGPKFFERFLPKAG